MKGRVVLLLTYGLIFLAVNTYGQDPPFAEMLTTDSSWCQQADNMTTAEILITGDVDTSRFDLVIDIRGTSDTLFNIPSGILTFVLSNKVGINTYILRKIIEHQNGMVLENDVNDTLIMEVKPLPDMALNIEYDEPCSPATITFTARQSYPDYEWDFGDGTHTNSSSHQISHTYSSEEFVNQIEYEARLKIITAGGCADSVTENVVLYPTPIAGFEVDSTVLHYPSTTVQLENTTSEGDWDFRWDFGDRSKNYTRDPGEHVYSSYGIYDIKMEWSTPNCGDSVVRQIEILPPRPVAQIAASDSSGCPPLQVSFTNNSLYGESYLWEFDDGSTSTLAAPTHIFLESKSHFVNLYLTGPSGRDSTEQVITVLDRPVPLFETNITDRSDGSKIYTFLNNSLNSYRYIWDFGDGYTSDDESPFHVFSGAGSYTVSLYAWSIDECLDTLIQEDLVIIDEGTNLFPTVFKWNGSGPTGGEWIEGNDDNTTFHPNVRNATKLRMIIYSRLGHRVFETNEVHVGWDGYINSSQLAVQGVYIYKAWITYTNGLEEIHSGDITFLH